MSAGFDEGILVVLPFSCDDAIRPQCGRLLLAAFAAPTLSRRRISVLSFLLGLL